MALHLAILPVKALEIDGAPIDPRWRAGLESLGPHSEVRKLLGKPDRWRISGASGFQVPVRSQVDPAPKKGARREHDRPRSKSAAVGGDDARHTAVLDQQRLDGRLKEVQRLAFFELPPHFPRVETPVALCPRGPHRRSLRTVQHPEVQRRAIRRSAHQSTERVHLAGHGSLCDTPDCRVAGHLSDPGQEGCDK